MISRRSVLAGAAAWSAGFGASACEAVRPVAPAASSPGAGSGPRQVQVLTTALGDVRLIAGENRSEWVPTVRQAAERVAARWGRAPRAVRVTICTSDEEFASAAEGLNDMTAAVTTPDGVVIGPAVRRTLTPAGRLVVTAHELTHARWGHFGGDSTALWLREGAAEWTALQGAGVGQVQAWPHLTGSVRGGRVPTGPPADSDFPKARELAYETSSAYVTYLVEQAGTVSLRRLLEARPRDTTARAQAQKDLSVLPGTFAQWLGARLGGHPYSASTS